MTQTSPDDRPVFGIPVETAPMEARLADLLPEDSAWQYEPKWDGFRCLAFRAGEDLELRAKSGKPLQRYFPEVAAYLRQIPAGRFVVDGELIIEIDGEFSFAALQARLHPAASRIRRLSGETPARFILFDMLVDAEGAVLIGEPLLTRRRALEAFMARAGAPSRQLELSPVTLDPKKAHRWLEDSRRGAIDGVMAKRRDGFYEPGARAMIKVKRKRTADCVVGGFRYAANSRKVGSLLLGLYDDAGKLDHVGFTSAISEAERQALTEKLEALRGPPGFTGRAPGGPSRWSTERSSKWEPLRPELVVEVCFDQVTDGRFRHGTRLMRWRPDKSPRQCKMAQLN
ncbi:ATP dependent DNA ligase [Methylocella silvestris BL2]|uniref:DNA ligase (ATP) n=1 Tax=Methylocella silvestris (strain DSM 15510 / CIP 108128 / LMG 27833 / NCIMB 13906 / BL2) TaxID=395965 RepID=B8EJB0_METSB|nr:ATP-dependent DNA ligase [Methylocella silvestris]ACK52602.1 ATP dependent DNA ligase [Methylocella silvestris BL2]